MYYSVLVTLNLGFKLQEVKIQQGKNEYLGRQIIIK